MGATTLNISVSGIDQVLLNFNVIRIKRSTTGVDGTYSLLTADAPAPATLTAGNAGNYDVAGKTLKIFVDQGAQVDILFTGLSPLTVPQVVGQINTALGASIASDVGNTLVLTSTTTGTASRIELVDGSANAVFGFSDGERDIGEEAHVLLQTDVSSYTFIDKDGESGYFYKAQFYNTSTGLESNDSSPFEGDVGTLISTANLSTAKVDLVDGRGVAVEGQEISFYPHHDLLEVEGYQVALTRAPIVIQTNNAGHAEVTLVRGLKVKVVFEGTSLIRDITVPDAAEFNLLSEMNSVPDPFDVADPNFPPAFRRTL